ncbi:hypothetical protein F5884DRAFT_900898 [Xylogone sp. PMI_703]|nr:hypothetical protein F5884DRAFT_900898 [Xylogone sp. PMI_703]
MQSFGLGMWIMRGKVLLSKSKNWDNFLRALKDIELHGILDGTAFELLQRLMRRCSKIKVERISSRTRSHTEELDLETDEAQEVPVKTEELVNTTIILFLDVLSSDFMKYNMWSPERKMFIAGCGEKEYKSRVDGLLEDEDMGCTTRAIVEAKKSRRVVGEHRIQMQEAAAMVGWIINDPPLRERRKKNYIQISQDRNEIYITIPDLGDKFVDYLCGKEIHAKYHRDSFMIMRQFGPWMINNQDHMEKLGAILLGICLRAEDDAAFERGV